MVSVSKISLWIVTTLPVVQYLQFLNLIPNFNSTFIYEVLLVIFATRFFINSVYHGRSLVNISALLASSLLFIMLIQQLVWLPEFIQAGAQDVFQSNFALTAIIPLCLFFTGVLVKSDDKKFMSYVYVYSLYIFVIITGVIYNFRETGLTVIKFVDYSSFENFNYLTLADVFAIVSIIVLSYLRFNPLAYFTIFTVSIVMLTATFSRTSLVIFVICCVVQLFINRSLRLIGFIGILSLTSVCIIYFSTIQNSENFIRISTLISDPTADNSFIGRSDIASNRIADLNEHILTGKYMAEWWTDGKRGGYFHNIFSYVDSYGIFVFLGIVLNLVYLAMRPRMGTQGYKLVLLYSICSVLFSRSYVWPYLWLSIGLVSNVSLDDFKYKTLLKRNAQLKLGKIKL